MFFEIVVSSSNDVKAHTHWTTHDCADRILNRSPVSMRDWNVRVKSESAHISPQNQPMLWVIVAPIHIKHVYSSVSYQ